MHFRLSAALSGAGIAFLFAIWREKRRQEDNQYAALRLAHLAVMSHYQKLISLWDSCLREHKGDPDAWQRLLPVKALFTGPALNVAELVFAFESSDPDLLNRLVVGEAKYLMIRDVIAMRNSAHLEFQHHVVAFQAKGIDDAEVLKLGKHLVAQLQSLTAELIDATPAAIDFLEANLQDIKTVAAEHFPKRKPPEFEVLPKSKAAHTPH